MSAKSKKSKKGGSAAPSAPAAVGQLTPESMTKEDLLNEFRRLQDDLNKEREERNYFQLERDRVHEFWQITQQQLADLRNDLLHRDRQVEEAEENHQTEIKVYKQKVKHLLYEYQNNTAHIQTDAEKQQQLLFEDGQQQMEGLKKQIRGLKLELKEMELSHQEVIKSLKLKQDQEITKLRLDFDRRCRELYAKYATRTKQMREELEMRRKNELHEVEERKNSQINTLMKNHEKSFAEIKNYYNDITLNNLALINSLKEQVEEMKKKEEKNERMMADITAANKRMKEPLDAALAEGEQLKKQLKSYEKDKLALQNTKARLKVLEDDHKQILWEKEVLEQRFEQVQKERDDLYREFSVKCKEVEQRVGLKNMILEKKLEAMRDTLEKKDVQLSEVIAMASTNKTADGMSETTSGPGSHVAPESLSQITSKVSEVLDTKTRLVKDLQYELARVVKAYNDMLHVYEAKMAEWNIPTDELGFRPLVVHIGSTTIGSLANKEIKSTPAAVYQQQRDKMSTIQQALDKIPADARIVK